MCKKTPPLIAKMDYEMKLKGISNQEMAVALRMSLATLYNRRINPDNFTYQQLKLMAKKLKIPIAELVSCKGEQTG